MSEHLRESWPQTPARAEEVGSHKNRAGTIACLVAALAVAGLAIWIGSELLFFGGIALVGLAVGFETEGGPPAPHARQEGRIEWRRVQAIRPKHSGGPQFAAELELICGHFVDAPAEEAEDLLVRFLDGPLFYQCEECGR